MSTLAKIVTTTKQAIFRGKYLETRGSVNSLIRDYSGKSILRNPTKYLEEIKAVYNQEKEITKLATVTDLSNAADLCRLDFHVKVHAITGVVAWGTSNTFSIPYWDRQALSAGLLYQFPRTTQQLLARNNAESINALRGCLTMLASLCEQSLALREGVQNFITAGYQTRRDISEHTREHHSAWNTIYENARQVVVAKLKHVLFLIDKLDSRNLREFLLVEIQTLANRLQINESELNIKLGVDAGLSSVSYRPEYEIHPFKQLWHYQSQAMVLVDKVCPAWSFDEIKNSILRDKNKPSYLIEPESIKLEWKF